MDDVTAEHGIQVLIPPDSGKRKGERPGWTGGRYSFMRRVLASELGKQLYRKRQQSNEPVYGHTKRNRRFDRFHRRGRLAVRTEWRLIGSPVGLGVNALSRSAREQGFRDDRFVRRLRRLR